MNARLPLCLFLRKPNSLDGPEEAGRRDGDRGRDTEPLVLLLFLEPKSSEKGDGEDRDLSDFYSEVEPDEGDDERAGLYR